MLPVGPRRPQRQNLLLNPMEKGLTVLRSMAGHTCQPPAWKLHAKQQSLSKSTQAINLYCRRKSECLPDASPTDSTFLLEMQELRSMFLQRPGCPQFCTRATSMSRSGPLLPGSQSAGELEYLRKSESQQLSPAGSSPALDQSRLRKRVPWYISVIHEKDYCLSTLVEEVQRLAKLKGEVQRRDEEILALQGEREALKKQLKYLLKSRGRELSVCQEWLPESGSRPQGRLSILQDFCREDELQSWRQLQEEFVLADRAGGLESGGEEEEAGLEGEAQRVDQGAVGRKEAEGEEGEEEEPQGLELDEEREAQQAQEGGGLKRFSCADDAFEEELIAQLEEYEQVIQEFQLELGVARTRYNLATGACISLQRQVDRLESQQQQVNMEHELLQKELRERKRQLQAMTDKFSNLREEKKQKEVMGLIEKDNLFLRQQVWELEHELATREHAIAEAEARAGQLQAQVSQCLDHLERRKQLQEQAQSKIEAAQQAEQQVRVALESAQSRLERLRNKVIQAAFSTPGIRSFASEISDNDILEALQRIISERMDYYNQLKHKGVKVPPLLMAEVFSSSKSKKVTSK
uniref:Coiled-coil domain containing 27 n=1 Tax=Myotis myotis TaxID=51298 RepID=A0A7J7ZTL1_MYOMY|nr:coiled-coil domain containing 27 [Myotis myotis]